MEQRNSLKNKVVIITGGSKGLGLELARELLAEGSKVAICSRTESELVLAHEELNSYGGEVYHAVCDVGHELEVNQFISDVTEHFGQIDIVVNNAGIIMVGAFESFTLKEFKKAMDVMYWGIVNTTLAVLPQMKERQSGQIINVTSIGGKVSIPHLLPYSAAKFAAVGFSEGIAAELKKDNINVTTIVPGLMRTGSYINALFQKNNKKAFKLFSAISSTPVLTVTAEKAARNIVKAMKQKKSLKVIGVPAKLLIEIHHFFPELTVRMFGLVSRFLPSALERKSFEKGEKIQERSENAEVPGLRKIGQKAQSDHQHNFI